MDTENKIDFANIIGVIMWGCLGLGIPIIYTIFTGNPAYSYDVDDLLRAAQIKDLLADGNWRDLHIPGISMPDKYFSPWSRLVDILYVLPTLIMTPLFGVEASLRASFVVVPVLIFIPFWILFSNLAGYFSGKRISLIAGAITILFLMRCILEFAPTRIDHHNIQLLLLMCLCWGLLSIHKFSGHIMGAAIVLSVAIGLETSPLLFATIFSLVFFAWLDDHELVQKMKSMGYVLWLTSLPLAFLLLGSNQIHLQYCDTFTYAWATGMTGGGLIFSLAPYFWERISSGGRLYKLKRFAIIAIPSLILVALCAYAFPICLAGPMHMVDPIAKTFWLDNVYQEQSIFWHARRPNFEFPIMLWAFSISFTLLAFKLVKPIRPTAVRKEMVFFILCIFTVVLGTFYPRYEIFYCALIGLLLPRITNELAKLRAQSFFRFYSTLLVFFVPSILVISAYILAPKNTYSMSLIEAMQTKSCLSQNEASLSDLPASKIIAPLGLSFGLFHAQTGHEVAAIQFHRASPGIRRIGQTFGDYGSESRKMAMKPFDYLAICRFEVNHTDEENAPLYKALLEGRDWPGLTPLNPNSDTPFLIYRISHSELE